MSLFQHGQEVLIDLLDAQHRLYLSAIIPVVFGLRRLLFTQTQEPQQLDGNMVRIISLVLFSVIKITARLNRIRRTREVFFTTPLKMAFMALIPCFTWAYSKVLTPNGFGVVLGLYAFTSLSTILHQWYAEQSGMEITYTMVETASDLLDVHFTFERQLGHLYATAEYFTEAITWGGALLIIRQPFNFTLTPKLLLCGGLYACFEFIVEYLNNIRANALHTDYRNLRLITLESHLEVIMGSIFNGVTDLRHGLSSEGVIRELCWQKSFTRGLFLFSFLLICYLDQILCRLHEEKYFTTALQLPSTPAEQ